MRRTLYGMIAFVVCAALWAVSQPAQAQITAQYENISRCGSANVLSVVINTATTANNELVALAAGKTVYVCGFNIDNDTATTGLQFITGTGTACATNEADLTGVMTVATWFDPQTGAVKFKGAASSALCIELSTNTQVNGYLTYVQY